MSASAICGDFRVHDRLFICGVLRYTRQFWLLMYISNVYFLTLRRRATFTPKLFSHSNSTLIALLLPIVSIVLVHYGHSFSPIVLSLRGQMTPLLTRCGAGPEDSAPGVCRLSSMPLLECAASGVWPERR